MTHSLIIFIKLIFQQSSYDGDFAMELERVGAGVTSDDDCVVPNLRRVPSLSDLSEEGSLGMLPQLFYFLEPAVLGERVKCLLCLLVVEFSVLNLSRFGYKYMCQTNLLYV